jgi:hypothetical protein
VFAKFLLHFRSDLGTESSVSVCSHAKEEEGQERRKIQSKNRGDKTSEKVEVGISDSKNGLENRNSLCLWEPGQQDTSSNNYVVNREEVHESANENLFGNVVYLRTYQKRGQAELTSTKQTRRTQLHELTTSK